MHCYWNVVIVRIINLSTVCASEHHPQSPYWSIVFDNNEAFPSMECWCNLLLKRVQLYHNLLFVFF